MIDLTQHLKKQNKQFFQGYDDSSVSKDKIAIQALSVDDTSFKNRYLTKTKLKSKKYF